MKLIALFSGVLLMANSAVAEVKIALDTKPDLSTSGSYNWVQGFSSALTAAGLSVREMPRGSVGKEAEKFDQISTGLLEISLSDVRSIAQVVPFIYGVRLPYLFDDSKHLQRVLEQGKIFDKINIDLAKQDAVLLALVPLGPSSGIITSKAVVRKPSDMSALRMRALDDAQIAMYKAWGSTGTVVPWGEVPAALQTGVVDGYLNSPFVPIMFGQTDIVKNFSDAGVIVPMRAVLASKLWYDGLTVDHRKVVDIAVEQGNKANQQWLDAVSESSLTALEDAGVTVQRLTSDERDVFRQLSKAVYDSGLMPKDDVSAWVALSEAAR